MMMIMSMWRLDVMLVALPHHNLMLHGLYFVLGGVISGGDVVCGSLGLLSNQKVKEREAIYI